MTHKKFYSDLKRNIEKHKKVKFNEVVNIVITILLAELILISLKRLSVL